MCFPCDAIVKNNTNEFWFWDFFHLLAIEIYGQWSIHCKASKMPYHVMCLFTLVDELLAFNQSETLSDVLFKLETKLFVSLTEANI